MKFFCELAFATDNVCELVFAKMPWILQLFCHTRSQCELRTATYVLRTDGVPMIVAPCTYDNENSHRDEGKDPAVQDFVNLEKHPVYAAAACMEAAPTPANAKRTKKFKSTG